MITATSVLQTTYVLSGGIMSHKTSKPKRDSSNIKKGKNVNFKTLTTPEAIPISDNQNSLKQGDLGPTLMEDFHLRQKLFHFDHERIPERVVHARGYGVHGYFENYKSLNAITAADLFQREGEKTPVFVRFSTVAGNQGSADLARDVRGFAVKFYTQQGNWDLVGNNIPVFFIQDAIKFPDLIHAAKQEPDRGFPQAQTAHDNFWDFISLMPEAMHMAMWIMSDRAIPRSFRFMEGFGVHTFKLVNAKGQSTYVKFHWKPKLGMQSVLWNEALKINGADPDFHRRDMWNAINNQQFPEWELGLQLFDDQFAEEFEFDVLDATKLIPEELVPVTPVGRLVLNKMPENFFAETEQVAFQTSNIVPGIDFTNDPLLQGRNFSYLDTQLKRLGSTNFNHLPINAPKCPFAHFQQDGHMSMHNPQGRVNYEPNGWSSETALPKEVPDAGLKSTEESQAGLKSRQRPESFSDHYSQARQFYISQTDIEKAHILNAFTFELSKCENESIQRRMIAHLLNIDSDLAQKLAANLCIHPLPDNCTPLRPVNNNLSSSKALSILKNEKNTFEGRKLGILLGNHFAEDELENIKKEAQKRNVQIELIGYDSLRITSDKGNLINANQIIEGAPSALFDAVIILASQSSVAHMVQKPEVREFVTDAYCHLKFIGITKGIEMIMTSVGLDVKSSNGVILFDSELSVEKYFHQCKHHRCWKRML